MFKDSLVILHYLQTNREQEEIHEHPQSDAAAIELDSVTILPIILTSDKIHSSFSGKYRPRRRWRRVGDEMDKLPRGRGSCAQIKKKAYRSRGVISQRGSG